MPVEGKQMNRLTDEQREQVAAHVPLAIRLAKNWCYRRGLTGAAADEVRCAFLLGLMVAVATYDPERGASLQAHLYIKTPRAATDVMRDEWGRDGTGRREMMRRTELVGFSIRSALDRGGANDEAEYRDLVSAIRRNLPAAHARALLETVGDGRACGEVAREMGLKMSRLSQLRSEAVQLLRDGGFMKGARS